MLTVHHFQNNKKKKSLSPSYTNTQYEQHLSLNKDLKSNTRSCKCDVSQKIYSEVTSALAGLKQRESSLSSQPPLLLPLSSELCSIWAFRRVGKVRHCRDTGTRRCYPTADTQGAWDFGIQIFFTYSFLYIIQCMDRWLLQCTATTDVCFCRLDVYCF